MYKIRKSRRLRTTMDLLTVLFHRLDTDVELQPDGFVRNADEYTEHHIALTI